MKPRLRLCIILVQLGMCFCFFGRQRKDGNIETKTHKDITSAGVLQAITQYLEERKGSSSIQNFYEHDNDLLTTMMGRVSALGSIVSNIQEEKKKIAYIHCHGNQIHVAHNHVKSCKKKLHARKADTDELMKQLGECLYTVQSFYSNTNWVEMNGAVPFTDFGIVGVKEFKSVVSQDQASCQDMDSISHGCTDNIVVKTKLTSGYHHGRGSTKPPILIGSKQGKCSHGGPEDSSRERVARCGINKDSVTEAWSPHYHLHKAAYDAAVNATTHFLIGPETGILYSLGEDAFEQLFQIIERRHRVSLSFAIDYTGSMSNDIAVVKEQSIQFVARTLGTENAPVNYVLALFNDPENLTYGVVHNDGNDMIQALSDIRVYGGGDCPEYAASGILKAIEMSLKDSTVLLFTDADAKDESRFLEVQTAALEKGITIKVLLTGKCGFRKRRSALRRVKRDISFFEAIANATGGKVYETSTSNLGAILNEVLEDVFPTTELINETSPVVIIDSFIWSSNLDKPINVDAFVENPTPGIIYMKVKIMRSNIWIVNVTAQSKLYADVEILQFTENSDLITVQGNLITGSNYSITWTVNHLDPLGACNNIIIVNSEGDILSVHPASTTHTDVMSTCSADITASDVVFELKLEGTDGNGNVFSRKSPSTFKPVTVKLTIKESTGDAVIGHNRDIGFEVKNMGSDVKKIDVSFVDDQGFAVLPTMLQFNITSGETVNGTFTVKPTVPSVIFSYTITVTDSDSDNHQKACEIDRPSCSVVSSYDSCDDLAISYANCSLYSWNSIVEVTFSGTQIDSISSTGGAFVTLTHDGYQNMLQGPVGITIKLDFSHERDLFEAVEVISSAVEQEIGSDSIIGIVIGTTSAVVACIIVATIVIRIHHSKSKLQKIQDWHSSQHRDPNDKEANKNNFVDVLDIEDEPGVAQK